MPEAPVNNNQSFLCAIINQCGGRVLIEKKALRESTKAKQAIEMRYHKASGSYELTVIEPTKPE